MPFAKFGPDFVRATVFGYRGRDYLAVRYGGGFDAYVTRHFGIETQVFGDRLVYNSSVNLPYVTFGVFYRTR